jgi:hypothetical protein
MTFFIDKISLVLHSQQQCQHCNFEPFTENQQPVSNKSSTFFPEQNPAQNAASGWLFAELRNWPAAKSKPQFLANPYPGWTLRAVPHPPVATPKGSDY